MNADGTQVQQLTNDDRFNTGPVWSPDSQRITFTSGISPHEGPAEIFIINADGTDPHSSGQQGFVAYWE